MPMDDLESRADNPAPDKVVEHEEAAHEKRNWVRLTFDCNDHCVFCLDTDAHNGTNRAREEIKEQILDGRRKGAERLILSGGEPTIHPNYVDFIKLGKRAGYPWIQTVTNGRMFSYPPFLKRCLDAGLDEITFSLHGPNAKIHDALVGVKGAFDEETAGLRHALVDGRPIINIDVCVNKANVKHLPEMLETFISWGVKEFDLLQVIPFGNAFQDGRDILFYDLEEMQPFITRALEYSKRPDVHIWMNRFPPPHLEGYEHLIQDPYKLNDEVKGRREEYEGLLERGVDLVCRQPERCHYCYLEDLCDTLYDAVDTVRARAFDVVRVDTEWEAKQGPVWGGDPASKRKADAAPQRLPGQRKRTSLPVLGAGGREGVDGPPQYLPLPQLLAETPDAAVWLVAPDLAAARARLETLPSAAVELELADYAGFTEALADERLDGRLVRRVYVSRADDAASLLARGENFDVVLSLTRDNEGWLRALSAAPPRLVVRQPTYERLTESAAHDVDLRAFFAAAPAGLRTLGVPACVNGGAPDAGERVLDTAMMREADGHLEAFRYAKRFIVDHYFSKSLRCKTCVFDGACRGMHINYVRAHGYEVMQPVTASPAASLDSSTAAAQ